METPKYNGVVVCEENCRLNKDNTGFTNPEDETIHSINRPINCTEPSDEVPDTVLSFDEMFDGTKEALIENDRNAHREVG